MEELRTGHVAVVTGGARGIGLAVVEALLARATDLGPVSYAVNCAGVDGLVPSAGMTAEEWRR